MIKAPRMCPHFRTYKVLAVFHVNSFYFSFFFGCCYLFIYLDKVLLYSSYWPYVHLCHPGIDHDPFASLSQLLGLQECAMGPQGVANDSSCPQTHQSETAISTPPLSSSSGHRPFSSRSTTCFLRHQLGRRERGHENRQAFLKRALALGEWGFYLKEVTKQVWEGAPGTGFMFFSTTQPSPPCCTIHLRRPSVK